MFNVQGIKVLSKIRMNDGKGESASFTRPAREPPGAFILRFSAMMVYKICLKCDVFLNYHIRQFLPRYRVGGAKLLKELVVIQIQRVEF